MTVHPDESHRDRDYTTRDAVNDGSGFEDRVCCDELYDEYRCCDDGSDFDAPETDLYDESLALWEQSVADRYGLVSNWSDADNLSRHMYAGAGPQRALLTSDFEAPTTSPDFDDGSAIDDGFDDGRRSNEAARLDDGSAIDDGFDDGFDDGRRSNEAARLDDGSAIDALSDPPSYGPSDADPMHGSYDDHPFDGDDPASSGSGRNQGPAPNEGRSHRTKVDESIAETLENLIREDVTRKFRSVPENRYHSLLSSTGEPVFWNAARVERLQRRLKGMNDTFQVGRRILTTTPPPCLRRIPFPMALPIFTAVLWSRHRDPNHWYGVGQTVGETMPSSRINLSQRLQWNTVTTSRHLDTQDHNLLVRTRYINGHLFCTYHPNLYLHHTHGYIGNFVGRPAPGDGSGSVRIYTLAGHSYHNLLPSHVFRSNNDYLNQCRERMRVRKRARGVTRGLNLRRAVDRHNFFTLHDALPSKLDAVHSVYTVPGLRRVLPRTVVSDYLYVPPTRRVAAGKRRRVDLTLFSDARFRSRRYRRLSTYRRSYDDRATRMERLNRMFHHGLTDGPRQLGCSRNAHYHIYNNLAVFGELLSSQIREVGYPEVWGMTDAMRDPYAPAGLPGHHHDRADRQFRHRMVADLQRLAGRDPRMNDGSPLYGKPVFRVVVGDPQGHSPSRRKHRQKRRAEKALIRAVRDAYTDDGRIESVAARELLPKDPDAGRYLSAYQQRLFDVTRLEPSCRRLYRGRHRDALPLYALCHPTYADFKSRGHLREVLHRWFGNSSPSALADRVSRLQRRVVPARSEALRRLRSGYFSPDVDIDGMRYAHAHHRNPRAVVGNRRQGVPPGWVWRLVGSGTDIRDALANTAYGSHIVTALSVSDPSPTIGTDPTGSVDYAVTRPDFGINVVHEWDSPEAKFSSAAAEHERALAADFVDADRRSAVWNVEAWPVVHGPRESTCPSADVGPYARALFGQLRGVAAHDPTNSYTGFQLAQMRRLGRIGRLRELEKLKGDRSQRVMRQQAIDAGSYRDTAWAVARQLTRQTFGRRDPDITAALAQDLYHYLWDWDHDGDLESETTNPTRIMISDRRAFKECGLGKEMWSRDQFNEIEDEENEEETPDPDLPHYIDLILDDLVVDRTAANAPSTVVLEGIHDEEEEGFNSVEPFGEVDAADDPMWSDAHPRRRGSRQQSDRLQPVASEGRRTVRIDQSRPNDYVTMTVVHGDYDYGYDRSGGHGHHGRWWQFRNFKAARPFAVGLKRTPPWVPWYFAYLVGRAAWKFYRLQDRYSMPIFVAAQEIVFFGNHRTAAAHIWAQDPLIVHIGTNGLHRMVGGSGLLRPFMPAILFLRARRHGLNPLVVPRPRVDHFNTAGPDATPPLTIASRRGMLLVGPPGTGKTYMIRALAGEGAANAVIYGREKKVYRAMYGPQGEFWTAVELLHLFDNARQMTPCVVFIDEIDGLAPSRRRVEESLGLSITGRAVLTAGRDFTKLNAFVHWRQRGSNRPSFNLIKTASWHWRITNPEVYNEIYTIKAPRRDRRTTINSLSTGDEKPGFENAALSDEAMLTLGHLLVHIDGIDVQNNIVIGATNRPRAVDPALTRPGRLNKVVFVDLPSRQKRVELLRFYSRERVTGPVDWDLLARRSAGLSPAHLNAAINFSALINAHNEVQKGFVFVPRRYQPHDARSLSAGLRNVAFRAPGLQDSYRAICTRLNVTVLGGGVYTEHGHVGARAVLLEALRTRGGATYAKLASRSGVTVLDRVPVALAGALSLRQSYVNHYVRTRLIRERRTHLGSYRRDQRRRGGATLTVGRRRRGVMGSPLYPYPKDAPGLQQSRHEFYTRHAARNRRYYLMTVLDRATYVRGRGDESETIADVMGDDRDGVEAYTTLLKLSRRVFKRHLFGSTLLSHSGLACHPLVGCGVSPTYVNRGGQLIASDVRFSRYANLAPLTDHLATRGHETIFTSPRQAAHRVQQAMFADAYGSQRNAYYNAAKALIRARTNRRADDEHVYHMWSLLRNDERPPSEQEFVNTILQVCSSKGEFEGYLSGLLAGRVGEHWLIRGRQHVASDLGNVATRHVGWLLNVMIENNLYYRSTFQWLKQTATESLRQFYMKTHNVERIQHDEVQKEVRRREKQNDPGRFFTRRGAVFRSWVRGAVGIERWWRFELARARKKRLGTADERWFRDRAERLRRVYVQRKFMVNSATVKTGLTAPDLPGLDRTYESFLREFLGYFRASANQQLTSESESLRVYLMFEVYELINHYLDDHRALFDYLIFQIMTRGELDDTQVQQLVSRMLEIPDLDHAISQEWVDFERRAYDAGYDPVDDADYDLTGGVGRDPVDDAGYDPVDDAGRDPVDDAGYDPVDDAGYDPVDDAGRDPVDDAGRDPVDDAGRDPVDDAGYVDPMFGADVSQGSSGLSDPGLDALYDDITPGSDSPASGSDSPASGSDSPASGSDSPASGSDSPASGSDSPASGLDALYDDATPDSISPEPASGSDSGSADSSSMGSSSDPSTAGPRVGRGSRWQRLVDRLKRAINRAL